MIEIQDFEDLITRIRQEYREARRIAGLAEQAGRLEPVSRVGEIVRRERINQELTQQELCDLSGVSYSTLSKLERGKNPAVRLDVLRQLLDALGLKLWVG